VVRDLSPEPSNWRAEDGLSHYLRENGILGIADIDTRKLTRILRERGAQNGCLMAAETLGEGSAAEAIGRARRAPSMAGLDLAKEVSCTEPYEWNGGTWALGTGYKQANDSRHRVVAYDYGL